jgi:hypothetical protein
MYWVPCLACFVAVIPSSQTNPCVSFFGKYHLIYITQSFYKTTLETMLGYKKVLGPELQRNHHDTDQNTFAGDVLMSHQR